MASAVDFGPQLQTYVRVLLADDSPSMLQAARRILEPECEVVGTVDDGQAVLEATKSLNPDVLDAIAAFTAEIRPGEDWEGSRGGCCS